MDVIGRRGAKAIWDDYAAIARRRGPSAVEGSALRTRSTAYRDLAAHLASDGRMAYGDVVDVIRRGSIDGLDPAWCGALGRIVGLQGLEADDHLIATELLRYACTHGAPDRYAKLLVELFYVAGDFARAWDVLESRPALTEVRRGYLVTDLINPFTASPYANPERWLARFTDQFSAYGLHPPRLEPGTERPLDRLRSAPGLPVQDGPLISVVMTTFNPDPVDFLSSVRSILDQTWRNLELIIVDDCSAEEFRGTLDFAAEMDDRVRVVTMPKNGGTYLARNRGIEEARGEIITGQDDDDWSHPQRLELQVRPLIEDPALPGTRSHCITAIEDLVMLRPGYGPIQPNASSLMFRRETARELGGFLPSRRGADTEFHRRLEKYTGRTIETIQAPLAVVRILTDSLSRPDFGAGWHHPARVAFRSAYTRWHATAEREDLRLAEASASPVPVPRRFAIEEQEPPRLDVVLAGDWRAYGGPQKSMIEEIRALRRANLSVGILHFEAARFMTQERKLLCAPIQDLLNAGEVVQIMPDEEAQARLTVLRYPPILQFPPPPVKLVSERLVILANQAPSERDGTDIRYDVRTCADNAERVFGIRGLWAPQGPTVRGATEHLVPPGELAAFNIPGILDVDEWVTERESFRSDRPVIGRHSRDNAMKWPDDRELLRRIYPVDGSVDVRIMGGERAALAVLGTNQLPSSWVSFPYDYLDVRTFLNSIDFFVYYQHSQAYDAFGRATLEALATGCVGILPHHLEPTFGPAALYAEPEEVIPLVQRLYADPEAYRAQSRRAIAHIRTTFSHQAYVRLVEDLLSRETLVPRGPRGVEQLVG